MRALFLDFDGPLHPTSLVVGLRPGVNRLNDAIRERGLFCWLSHLDGLLADHEDVCIVVHSAWREYASNSEIREALGPLGDRLAGVTPIGVDRYAGILEVVRRFEIDPYLIIDDAIDAFPDGLPQLCAADPNVGLSSPALRECVKAWLVETAEQKVSAPAPALR